MPNLDGIKACRRLRAEYRTQSIPIIALTGFGGILVKVNDAGADDAMMKPVCMEELSHRVRAALHLGHQSQPEKRLVTHLDQLINDSSNWSATGRIHRGQS
jgi:DNA-binding response OmpR family regulator